jgi:hypothetical protein
MTGRRHAIIDVIKINGNILSNCFLFLVIISKTKFFTGKETVGWFPMIALSFLIETLSSIVLNYLPNAR